MATSPDLTGAWIGDDGAIYYIRQLDDHSVWWAGLQASGFHPGVTFTNVFRGEVIPDDLTIVGSWADVPRGATFGQGKLTIEIVETKSHHDTDSRSNGGSWPTGEVPPEGGPRQPSGRKLELRQVPEGTTGRFGGTRWRPWGLAEQVDIREKFRRVRRYDGAFDESNSAVRDFAVAIGKIQWEDRPHVSWLDSIPREYWFFVTGFTGGSDGDLNFNIENVKLDPEFWEPSDDWLLPVKILIGSPFGGESAYVSLESPADVSKYWADKTDKHYYIHDEGVMFGRTNTDSVTEPDVLLPGWMETGGDSILLNGRPVNGQVTGPLKAGDLGDVSVAGTTLVPGTKVRVTGAVNFDNHGWPALELHPVYSIDVFQDFDAPRPGADLTGVWHSNDVGFGTYYLRQLGDDTVWWLGLSHDQGRTFANVFHGHIRFRDDEGLPLETPVVAGDWVDVPIGLEGRRSSGRVQLAGNTGPQIATAWTLTTVERTFGASCMTKLFDSVQDRPSVAIFSGAVDVTHGQTLDIDKFDLDEGTFGQSYRLVMANLAPPLAIQWSAAGIVSNPQDAATDITFTGLSVGRETRGVAVRVTDAHGQTFSLRFRVSFVIEAERVGKNG
jgi:hypothetical protein